MELESVNCENGIYRNGLGERVHIEDSFVYPLLKSSDVAHGRSPRRWVIVPQSFVGEDTARLEKVAPRTWRYLCDHGDKLDARKSSIYQNKSRFAIFGIGPYSFAPWKVAISGFYKKLSFTLVGPQKGKPVFLDDTVYFLPAKDEAEARQLACVLNSERAYDFFSSCIFWDEKRPITAKILGRLDIAALL